MRPSVYPPDDKEFREFVLSNVARSSDGGWSISLGDGTGFHVPPDSPIEPAKGMLCRLYGKGLGARVRGMFIDQERVYYRTEAEDAEYAELELYGKDAAEWLARWDAGRGVWSIEMGGLGPGYEQAIQITAAEILRELLATRYDIAAWPKDKALWDHDREQISDRVCGKPPVQGLGLSGAQWGAASNVAHMLFERGPLAVMKDERVKDRHIQVSRTFPQG